MSPGWTKGVASERGLVAWAFVIFLAVAALAGVDIWADLQEGTPFGHVASEAAILLVALLGSSVMAARLVQTTRLAKATLQEARSLAEQLAATSEEADQWRRQARGLMQGLGEALDEQFDRWSLTTAEKEVALLLLKGLSHRDIAELRSVAEATVRQQARAVYRKGGLSGRHDLSAFFLEDLMLPRGASSPGAIDPPAERTPDAAK